MVQLYLVHVYIQGIAVPENDVQRSAGHEAGRAILGREGGED
jgi:hypothetical protein